MGDFEFGMRGTLDGVNKQIPIPPVMITLVRGGDAFSPESLGPRDILLGGERIPGVAQPGTISVEGVEAIEIDA